MIQPLAKAHTGQAQRKQGINDIRKPIPAHGVGLLEVERS